MKAANQPRAFASAAAATHVLASAPQKLSDTQARHLLGRVGFMPAQD